MEGNEGHLRFVEAAPAPKPAPAYAGASTATAAATAAPRATAPPRRIKGAAGVPRNAGLFGTPPSSGCLCTKAPGRAAARSEEGASSALVAMSVALSPTRLGAVLLQGAASRRASMPACNAAPFSSSSVLAHSRVRLSSSFRLAHVPSERRSSRCRDLWASRRRRSSSFVEAVMASFSKRSTCSTHAASSNDLAAMWPLRISGRQTRYASIARCSASRGIKVVEGSSKPVIGEVIICLICLLSRNHLSMYSRSYEQPSTVATGSTMIAEEIGQKKLSGTGINLGPCVSSRKSPSKLKHRAAPSPQRCP
mmetsp:Transcript_18367/g.64503  ORF Transcript_18367/g.64503 Transcript_18367/m.64503 type:complete len:308 (+) Transcript_18367:2251-3174(+)